MGNQLPDRATLTAFGTTVLIGGTNFFAVKVTLAELAPIWGAGLRFAAAALLLLAIAKITHKALPRGRAFGGAVLYGVLAFGLSYALIYIAMVSIGAGTASVVLAATPLSTLMLAVAHRQEKLSARGLIGGLLVIGGIGALSLNRLGGGLPLLPLLLAVGAVLAAAEATVLVKGFPKADPITTNAVGMAAGALALLVVSPLVGEPWLLPATGEVWGAMVWLAAPGSVGLFVLFLYVVKRWTASASVYALTLMPLVAVTLGVVFLGEAITVEMIAGAILVISGVYVGALSRPRKREPEGTHLPAPQET